MTAEAYARVLRRLLPRGRAWEVEEGSVREKLLLGLAEELARVDARGVDLLEEWDPSTADETIGDWERVLGLPDDCQTEIPGTLAERRLAATAKYVSRGGQTPQFYIDLAAELGHTITIDEFQYPVLRAGFRAGDRAYGNEWAHAWDVNATGPADPVLECVIRRAAPAHTRVIFHYS